jgi:hypothetical protein
MVIQPSPIAETSRLLFPSVRFFIFLSLSPVVRVTVWMLCLSNGPSGEVLPPDCPASQGNGSYIIARTDAIAVEGFDPALERAERYPAAGVDIVFIEAPESVERIRVIGGRFRKGWVPILANMVEAGSLRSRGRANCRKWDSG